MSCHDAIIHDFEQTVAKFTDSVLGLRRDASILIALSGGADSVALLLALHRLRFMCVAAHCNFHLRGEESRRDMLFCRELCLLYTSPSPRDGATSRMPSYA